MKVIIGDRVHQPFNAARSLPAPKPRGPPVEAICRLAFTTDRSSASRGRPSGEAAGKQVVDQRPFYLCQIARVALAIPPIVALGDFRPGHMSPSNLANPKESQLCEIA